MLAQLVLTIKSEQKGDMEPPRFVGCFDNEKGKFPIGFFVWRLGDVASATGSLGVSETGRTCEKSLELQAAKAIKEYSPPPSLMCMTTREIRSQPKQSTPQTMIALS